MRLTIKQRYILEVLCAGNRDANGEVESWCDVGQLLDRLAYETTRPAILLSIRILIQRGFVIRGEKESRRGQQRSPLIPTQMAMDASKTGGKSAPKEVHFTVQELLNPECVKTC